MNRSEQFWNVNSKFPHKYNFKLLQSFLSTPALGPTQPIFNEYREIFLRVGVKNVWSHTYIFPIRLQGVCIGTTLPRQ
jgi:hypothetical protein